MNIYFYQRTVKKQEEETRKKKTFLKTRDSNCNDISQAGLGGKKHFELHFSQWLATATQIQFLY